MYLKRIDIYGFKSFGQDVHLDLPPGITVLVGPNGGGKSNVVDAIRWALGEQKVRELRADRWEDLLFVGAPGRPGARLAEVTLTFDNTDGEMPGWPEALTLTRRYYRSGDSEYLINGRSGRLKDVTDLFLDSGLGRFSYAVVSQGRVESALLQKPRERFEQLEEAAGVSRYKMRRRETLRHLEEAEADLARIGALSREVSQQLDTVRARAEAEERYLRWEALRHDWAERLRFTEFTEARSAETELAAEHAKLVGELAALSHEFAAGEEALAGIRTRAQALDAEVAELLRLAAGRNQNERIVQERIRDLDVELAGLRRELEVETRQLAELQQMRERLAEERAGETDAVSDADQIAELAEECKRGTDQLAEIERGLADGRGRLQELRSEAGRLAAERARLGKDMARAEGMLQLPDGESYEDNRQRLEAEAALRSQSVQRLNAELAQMTEQRQRLRQFIGNLERELEPLRQQVAQRQARLRALRQLEAEGEGLSGGVRAVLKAQQDGLVKGVRGTLGSLVETEPELVLALETALGGSHQDLVVDSEQHARLAVRHLETHALGRATFLPLDTVRPGTVPDDDRGIGHMPGVIGWMLDLVRYPREIRAAVSHVLGRVLVAESLEHAVAHGRRHRFRYKTVTLDGQLVHAGGAITGGSRTAKTSRAGRRAEIDTLTARVGDEAAMVEAKEELLQGSRRELEALETRFNDVRERLSEERSQWNRVRELVDLRRNRPDLADLGGRLLEVETRLAVCEREIGELEEALAARDRERQRVAAGLAAASERRREADLAARQRELVRLRLVEEDQRLGERIMANARRRTGLASRIAGAEAALAAAGEALRQASLEARETEAARARLAAEREGLRDRELALENRSRVLRTEERRVSGRIGAVEQELVKLKTRWEGYQPPENMAALSLSEKRQAAAELARIGEALAELGAIVPGSLALFQQLSERLAFLQQEERDVAEARAELMRTLDGLDDEMAKKVKHVAGRVEHHFLEACRTLFGGGEGGFSWVPGDEGGVELWVRPPGKRPSNLSLLSGGEKALGGIAWLFALLTARPSPFVILDEVEASLDEANARKFAAYIREHRDTTQYVVVSHHKPTMEVADALWGITGDGRGQSRLVSVMLESAGTGTVGG